MNRRVITLEELRMINEPVEFARRPSINTSMIMTAPFEPRPMHGRNASGSWKFTERLCYTAKLRARENE